MCYAGKDDGFVRQFMLIVSVFRIGLPHKFLPILVLWFFHAGFFLANICTSISSTSITVGLRYPRCVPKHIRVPDVQID